MTGGGSAGGEAALAATSSGRATRSEAGSGRGVTRGGSVRRISRLTGDGARGLVSASGSSGSNRPESRGSARSAWGCSPGPGAGTISGMGKVGGFGLSRKGSMRGGSGAASTALPSSARVPPSGA